MSIDIHLAEGRKCRRCIKILLEVGTAPHFSDLCLRCDCAVAEFYESRGREVPIDSWEPGVMAPAFHNEGPYSIRGSKNGQAFYERIHTYDVQRQAKVSARYWQTADLAQEAA